jgi:DNA/RNA-binding domain of Phe-tRNA-synthetase-like protein
MSKIEIQPELSELFPELTIGCILAEVQVMASDDVLKEEMGLLCDKLVPDLTPESIRRHPVVEMTKNAYRKMGKDPNRYRPAAESLLRRLASGKELYHVNNMVDILNMVSVATGFSIGGYDSEKIQGSIIFGLGRDQEAYQGIGRGELNIENLPVFRDGEGAFGTSTSDSVRTMVTEETKKFLMVFPAFEKMDDRLNKALEMAEKLLVELGGVKEMIVSWQGRQSVQE